MPGISQVRHIVNRVFSEYLHPTTQQPSKLRLASSIGVGDTSLEYDDSMILPEELELLAPGTIIEIGSELVLLAGVNEDTNTLDPIIRGVHGTNKSAHSTNDIIYISPTWTRKMVFDAVGDSIVELWPRLYKTRIDMSVVLASHRGFVDSDAERVLAVYDSRNFYQPVDYSFLNYTRESTGKSIVCVNTSGPVDVKYIAKPKRPFAETESLDEINVDEQWLGVIILGAVINLLSQPDIERMLTDFLIDRMKAESVTVGTSDNLRSGIIQLFEYRMGRLINARDRDETAEQSIQQLSII